PPDVAGNGRRRRGRGRDHRCAEVRIVTPFTVLRVPAVILDRANVDTDQIIPARFLRKPRGGGYNQFLFHDLRTAEPGFPLAATDNPAILIAGANFGCGSSREGAVYALVDAGIRCVIAPSFGDIFAANAAKNGVLTIALAPGEIAALIEAVGRGAELTVDLPLERVRPDNGTAIRFAIDAFRKKCLVEGLDDIGLTLAHASEIAAFEAADRADRAWAAPSPASGRGDAKDATLNSPR
ncbi:MAG: 3-isopropylmalate dehydratase small subunit, partial [Acetobacteraceae bacterium]